MPAGMPAAVGPAAGDEQGGITAQGGVISEGAMTPSLLLDLQTERLAAASPLQASLQLDLQTEPPHLAAASGQDDQQAQQGSQLVTLQTQAPAEQPAGSSLGGLQASLRLNLQTEQDSGQPAASGQDHQQETLPPSVHTDRPDAQPAGSE